jgi:hypothetical protein
LPKSNIDIRLVDFANCVTGEDGLPEATPCPPKHVGEVDCGYLRGLRSLRTYLQRIWREINDEDWVERGEGEAMGLLLKGAGKAGAGEEVREWAKGEGEESGEVST